MRELAEHVIDITGSRSPLVYKLLPQDDPRQRQPDIGLARKKLDWSPATGLDAGLRETIAYFERLLGMRKDSLQPIEP